MCERLPFRFTATGFIYFGLLPPHAQPRILGVTLPVAGIFVGPDGEPLMGADTLSPQGDVPNLEAALEGFFFSQAAAMNRLPTLVASGAIEAGEPLERLGEMIQNTSGLLPEFNSFGKIKEDFKRPMLDILPTRNIDAAAAFQYGKMLRFGKHPMAGIIFSAYGGIEVLGRLRLESKITRNDEARLLDELLNGGLCAHLPISDHPLVSTIKDDALIAMSDGHADSEHVPNMFD